MEQLEGHLYSVSIIIMFIADYNIMEQTDRGMTRLNNNNGAYSFDYRITNDETR